MPVSPLTFPAVWALEQRVGARLRVVEVTKYSDPEPMFLLLTPRCAYCGQPNPRPRCIFCGAPGRGVCGI
jgi:hypothetical protein